MLENSNEAVYVYDEGFEERNDEMELVSTINSALDEGWGFGSKSLPMWTS